MSERAEPGCFSLILDLCLLLVLAVATAMTVLVTWDSHLAIKDLRPRIETLEAMVLPATEPEEPDHD